ncbi:unnamed protein product [Ilex paraguariensis]|uniref:TFIIS N-terminal domain-containing protein n=1 Tax=Ilex paraguariensis TaxID=185542 RepID=A0ABC8U9F8_9AQUA
MTLEDFFTLTEMKDGFTAPARVRELVTVMQKEKDCIVKNVGEASRQWSTVASTVAATENKDCLNLFIQLDGLWFMDRWLSDVQKFGSDTGGGFVEESVIALLQALEKLHIDHEKSVSSGIWMTVKNLLGHCNSRIRDSARALFDNWRQDKDSGAVPQQVENYDEILADETKESANLAGESGHPESSSRDISLSRGSFNEEKHVEPPSEDIMTSTNSDAIQSESVDNEQAHQTLDHSVMSNGPLDPVGSSVMSNPVKETLPIKEECLMNCLEGTTLIQTGISAVPSVGPVERELDIPGLSDCADDAKQMPKIRNSLEKIGSMAISAASGSLDHRSPSQGVDAVNALESLTGPGLEKYIDGRDKDHCLKASPFDSVGVGVHLSVGKSGADDMRSLNNCRSTLAFRTSDQGGKCNIDVLQDSPGNKPKLGKTEDPGIEDDGAVERRVSSSDESEGDLANESDFNTGTMDARNSDLIVRSSDIVLDYGIVDPLEVARQVAIEVEREVEDCREPSCSSSEKMSGGGIQQPDSPDSINGKQCQPIEGPPKEVPSGPDLSAEDSPVNSAVNLDAKPINAIQDTESSQITQAAQEPDANVEKSSCDFDLNQEVCSEDMDCQLNHISTPISIVSASRAAAPSGLPFAPLQFEGTLGWKGSAATSAFRPASPRRNNEGDKTLSAEGSHSSSRQRLDCLDIDLNVAECGDDKTTDLLPGKQIQLLSGLPSGESSLEASPRRSDRLKLDLNRVSDDGDTPSDWRMERQFFHHRNGHHSRSPSSSSSSKQPFLRNIDLNDQPTFLSDSSDHPYFGKSFQNLNAFGELKPDDSAISIFGTRVEVKRKDLISQTLPLPNGRIPEPSMDVNLARSGGVLCMGSTVPNALSPIYGYNALLSGPTMPFSSSTMYGPGCPVTYMVDSRGAPVIPQIVGSPSTLPPAFSPAPYIMSMTGPHGSNGPGPSRPNFDLNSGLMIEVGNRESGGLRQLFNPSQTRSMDEHLGASSQPSSSSGVGGKRKEPDSQWEPYRFNFRNQPPAGR